MLSRDTFREIRRRNLGRMLAPQSIAVVGVSVDPNKAGSQALRLLRSHQGRVYGVHPREREIQGVRCFPSFAALPEAVDLAVLAIPAELCVNVAREAAGAGVGGILIVSGGFGESGEAGAALQAQLQTLCAESGMRMLGPNTSGFIHAAAGCIASFVPGADKLRPGRVAVVAQSGGVNLSVSFLLDTLGHGVSLAVGLGNAVDVETTDVLEWLGDDPGTAAVALHLEGIPNGRDLYDTLLRLTAKKPVVALVAGRSDIGEFAVSHTGKMLGSHQRSVSALAQAGVVVVDSTEELAQAAAALACFRLPPKASPGVALVTGQAGPGLLIADGLKTAGIDMPALSDSTLERVQSLLPPLTYIKNPVDTGRPGPGFPDLLKAVSSDPSVDALLVFGLHEPAVLDPAQVLPVAARQTGKPLAFGTLGVAPDINPVAASLAASGIPVARSPEQLVLAARAWVTDSRAQWRIAKTGPGSCVAKAASPLADAFNEDRAKELLNSYGIRSLPRSLCTRREEAMAAFAAMAAPVAVKVVSAEILHKTEVGGVHLDISDEAALRRALDTIDRIPTEAPKAYLLEQMAPPGVELIIGGVRDPSWGACVVIGLGGVMAEAFSDTAVRLAPLAPADVADMVEGLRGRRLLEGFRHLPRCNGAAIAHAAMAIGRLLMEHPEISEIEVNPLRVDSDGAWALDALVQLSPADPA